MQLEETVRRLEQRMETLEKGRRRWRLACGATASAAMALWLLAGRAPLAADKDEKDNSVRAARLGLTGPDDISASISMSKYRDLDNIEKQSIDFRDAEGVLRARIAWFKTTPGVAPPSAVTTFGIYNGERLPIQVLPVD